MLSGLSLDNSSHFIVLLSNFCSSDLHRSCPLLWTVSYFVKFLHSVVCVLASPLFFSSRRFLKREVFFPMDIPAIRPKYNL